MKLGERPLINLALVGSRPIQRGMGAVAPFDPGFWPEGAPDIAFLNLKNYNKQEYENFF
jgi:hypothetical protein